MIRNVVFIIIWCAILLISSLLWQFLKISVALSVPYGQTSKTVGIRFEAKKAVQEGWIAGGHLVLLFQDILCSVLSSYSAVYRWCPWRESRSRWSSLQSSWPAAATSSQLVWCCHNTLWCHWWGCFPWVLCRSWWGADDSVQPFSAAWQSVASAGPFWLFSLFFLAQLRPSVMWRPRNLAVSPLHVSLSDGKWWHRGSFSFEIQDEFFGIA